MACDVYTMECPVICEGGEAFSAFWQQEVREYTVYIVYITFFEAFVDVHKPLSKDCKMGSEILESMALAYSITPKFTYTQGSRSRGYIDTIHWISVRSVDLLG